MGYERNDRRPYGGDRYGQDRGGWRGGYDRDRGGSPSNYDYNDRGFFDRAGDEVRSWFGDEEAERRRRYDERYDDQYAGRSDTRSDRGSYGGGRNDWDRDQYARSQGYQGQGYQGGSTGYTGGYNAGEYGRGRFDRQGSDYRSNERWQGSDRGGYGGSRGRDEGRFGTHAGGQASDHSYTSWRDRQMADFDRDYDDYRRENQSRFDTEFSSFRTKRQGQRQLMSKVQEHMDVVGSDGEHVGTVDHVRGDRIKLTKNDQSAGGHHHSIPCSWIDSVEENKVTISKSADEAKAAWREEQDRGGDERGGLFGGRDDNDRNDWSSSRNLNRSFSGTY